MNKLKNAPLLEVIFEIRWGMKSVLEHRGHREYFNTEAQRGFLAQRAQRIRGSTGRRGHGEYFGTQRSRRKFVRRGTENFWMRRAQGYFGT